MPNKPASCTRAAGDMRPAYGVSIMLTRRCNMTCAHCSVVSGPKLRGEPTREELIARLHAVADAGIGSVQLTGGEPMIREDLVFELLRIAKERGLVTSVSSNGFWGRRQATAWRTVAAMKRLGVARITISYDRYHAKFQGPQPALNIARAAEWCNMALTINITRVANDPELAEIVAPFEKRHQLKMRFYDVQEIGRAKELPIAELRGNTSGYCTACGIPALTDDGRMTACNGPSYFLDESSPLAIGSLRDSSMKELLDRHNSDPILETIRRAGPERLLRELDNAGVTSELGIRKQHSGMCDLCLDINTKPKAVALLRERFSAPAHQAALAARRMVITGGNADRVLGIEYVNGAGAARLWMDAASNRFERFDKNAEVITGRADFDWNRMARYLVRCGVARALAPMLPRPSLTRWAPSFFIDRLTRAGIDESLHDLRQREVLRRINATLDSIGESGVLLKGGAVLALDDELQGSLERRGAGDIDLHVDPTAASALRQKLLSSGFTAGKSEARTGPHHLAPVFFNGIQVEIHTRIMPSFWGLPEKEMLARARPLRALQSLSTLDAEGMILHAMVHSSAHMFSRGLRAAWDSAWLVERFPPIDSARLVDWIRQLAMPRSFWVPAAVLSRSLVKLSDAVLQHAPHDERERRLERVADVRLFFASEDAYEMNPFSKNGFFLMLHDSAAGKARHVASLFGREERESRRTSARYVRARDDAGGRWPIALQIREGVAQWKQFQELVTR